MIPQHIFVLLNCPPRGCQAALCALIHSTSDGAVFPLSLCSHPVPHPSLNREARHSLTWHSSKSESALERFEPVAVVQQLPDGRGTLFAPVAARRQKVFKRGKRSSFRVLFGQAKRTLKEKNHNVTFLLSYFCVTKSTKSQQREHSPLFANSLRVHELVAQVMRGKCVRHGGKAKVGSLTLSAASTIPRVRTYHTK